MPGAGSHFADSSIFSAAIFTRRRPLLPTTVMLRCLVFQGNAVCFNDSEPGAFWHAFDELVTASLHSFNRRLLEASCRVVVYVYSLILLLFDAVWSRVDRAFVSYRMGGTASSQSARKADEVDTTIGGLHILDLHLSGPIGLFFIVVIVAAITGGVLYCVARRRRRGAQQPTQMMMMPMQPQAPFPGYAYAGPGAYADAGCAYRPPPYPPGHLNEIDTERPGRPPGRLHRIDTERPAAPRRADEPGVLHRLQALAGANTGPAAAGTDSV